MLSIAQQLAARFGQAIQDAIGFTSDPLIGLSQNEKFGDYQSNAAMGLAKQVAEKTGQKTNPRAVAEQILAKLDLGDMAAEKPSIAGPGFINVRLSAQWLARQLASIETDNRLGIPLAPSRQRVLIDYSSPNIAKEMHIGHLRPTNIGDALSRVLEFQGNELIRQNHIGDWGTAFGMLLAFLKENEHHANAPISDIEVFYREAKKRFDADPAFATESRQAVVRLQSGAPEEMQRWRQIVGISQKHLDEMYALLNVKLTREHERGESFYNPKLADVVKELQDKQIAELSEGAIVVWAPGFEAPLIIRKSDGGFGYGTTDLAALRFRTQELKIQRLIYVTDARQLQHFKQFLFAGTKAGWLEGVSFEHVTFGTILGPDGKPIKTKSGESVKLKDVLNEAVERALKLVQEKNPELPAERQTAISRAVGIGAIKYFDLARDRVGDYLFDWEKMLAMDGNTAPYLQYAHARIKSIFRKAESLGQERTERVTIKLDSPFELALAKHMLRLGEVIEIVGRELKPHHLCTYLYDLASKFSGFFENCPVIQSEEPVRSSRMAICDLTARTMALGLDLLGIEHPEQM